MTHVDGSTDRALDTGALECDAEARACRLLDLGRHLLGARAALDSHGLDARHELLGKLETRLEQVRDDDGVAAGRVRREEGHEADGACAAGR